MAGCREGKMEIPAKDDPCASSSPGINEQVVHEIDPLRDPRWRESLRLHPAGSVFHTPEWLRA